MKLPKLQKIKLSKDVFVERSLPSEGKINVKVGEEIEPFTKLGMTKVSYGYSNIDLSLKLARGKLEDGFFYTGETLGRVGMKKIVAPFDGYLSRHEDKFVLKQEEKDYWLLSGVWGTVDKTSENRSVLLKTQALDINLAFSTSVYTSGELIVFPNPSEMLEIHYLEEFSKDVFGKIIYIGNYLSPDILNRASELGVSGILTGSADRTTLSMASAYGVALGVISGFGSISTPKYIFNVLKEISNRYVFFYGDRSIFRIPIPKERIQHYSEFSSDQHFVDLATGMRVQVFEKPYYGWIGKVESIQEGSVYVKLDDAKEIFEAKVPNLTAV